MLDTNTVSYLAREKSPKLRRHFLALKEDEEACISVITEAELLYGLARRPEAVHLHRTIHSLLANLVVLPWTSGAAAHYGQLRAANETRGITIGNLDLLIAAHAIAEGAILITSDKAFSRLAGPLRLANWR